MRAGYQTGYNLLIICGIGILIWASADLCMNTIRAILDLIGKKSVIEFCTLAQAGRLFGAPTVFLAFDTLITFSIICFILWSGLVVHMNETESWLWYFATTLNLISLSLVGLWTEIVRLREKTET